MQILFLRFFVKVNAGFKLITHLWLKVVFLLLLCVGAVNVQGNTLHFLFASFFSHEFFLHSDVTDES